MKQIKDSLIPLLTDREIAALITGLAHQIERDYTGKDIVLVCPLKGSFLFLADLCRKINLHQQIDFVYLSKTEKNGTVKLIKDISIDIAHKHVLIVEEIIDAGRTLSFLKERLLSSNPASLRIVALLDKPARRELSIRPDYVGMTIDDRYVVGYGMDVDEMGRNYSEIFVFPC